MMTGFQRLNILNEGFCLYSYGHSIKSGLH